MNLGDQFLEELLAFLWHAEQNKMETKLIFGVVLGFTLLPIFSAQYKAFECSHGGTEGWSWHTSSQRSCTAKILQEPGFQYKKESRFLW